jgi:hypothetical protein
MSHAGRGYDAAVSPFLRRVRFGFFAVAVPLSCSECGPLNPEAETASTGPTKSETRVTVQHTENTEEEAAPPPPPKPKEATATDSLPAKSIDPPAKPILSPSQSLIAGQTGEAPLPIPTTLAATRSTLFVFGRTRAGYVVRTQSQKGKAPTWSPPAVTVPAYDDDLPAVAIGDGEIAWFAASSPTNGVRIARVDYTTAAPRVTLIGKLPSKLGRVAAFVPLKSHLAVIGQDGSAITYARLDRATGFAEATAKPIAQATTSAKNATTRSPKATVEEDKILLAWDADDVAGALETPGTTPAERAAPKPGIYVRRFFGSGEPATPARRLTRPSFEAHTLDLVVELGACAVLATTPEGFEMFRFVRKGDDLGPYGGGLHLAPAGGDVALGADVIGTIGVTSTKLLRIGPGIKIVPSPLGFSAPANGSFDDVRIAMDGYGAHVLFGTRTPLGTLPTVARIDGEHMGPVLGTPWIGPPSQRLVFAGVDGDEALTLVIDGGAMQAVRTNAEGKATSTTAVPWDAKQAGMLEWTRSPVPRVARAAGEWIVGMKDGRALIATGARAGTMVSLVPPKGHPGGSVAFVQTGGKASTLRVVYVPPVEKVARLWTATFDPKQGIVSAWTEIGASEHNYGALGQARTTAASGKGGSLYLLTNAGPKVSSVAQTYGIVQIDGDGKLTDVDLDPPAPVQEVSLVPSLGGPAIVASITGKGVAARWLDSTSIKGWRDAFAYMPWRVKGDGPVIREKGTSWTLGEGTLPVDLGAEVAPYVGERCPYVLPTGARSLLLVCEESATDSPLAARVTTRTLRF